MKLNEGFVIIDFGSQFTQLICRRLRELGYFAEVLPYTVTLEKIKKHQPKGIILSGGPYSVFESDAPQFDILELEKQAPLLGICYGMQLIAHKKGGVVEKSLVKEYGHTTISWSSETQIFKGLPLNQEVWMSHGDIVKSVPSGFKITAVTHNQLPAAMESDRIWATQFHPEVSHTQNGDHIFKRFAELCQAKPNWSANTVGEGLIQDIKDLVKQGDVLCALSGGVDSSVTAMLLTRALGAERVHCVFVNNGLLRKNEYENVLKMYHEIGLHVIGVDATSLFLEQLKSVVDPEQKRKIIGRLFIEVFEDQLTHLPQVTWLAQGTLYPDVVESVKPFGGPTQTIKSHHNVGGLPQNMKLKIIEPLRWLFKDEVRRLGLYLGLPKPMIERHPFPGPGLAIRIIGEVSAESLEIVQKADQIFIDMLKEHDLYHKIWQAFCVLLPVQTVGVQGDGRTYEQVLALRAVTSRDGMTADWYDFEPAFLKKLSNQITNQVSGINRVVYDITSKPPGTIEWE